MHHEIGEKVWLATKHLPLRAGTRKLASIWTGPFKILDTVGPVAYRLQIPEEWNIHNVFHVSQLKGVIGEVALEEAVLVDSGAEFEVEKIVGKRFSRNKLQYLVKWKSYSDFENMWLDAEQLDHAREAVQEYELDLSRKTRSRRGSGVRVTP